MDTTEVVDAPWPRAVEALRDLIRQRPMVHALPPKCPYCGSPNTTEKDHTMTLVGGDPDPNHHWRYHVCDSCGKGFTYQHKHNHGWSTVKDHCLVGVHACFESVDYDCAHCNGLVHREYRELDGKTPASGSGIIFLDGKGGVQKTQRSFWKCHGCGREVETNE